MNVMNYLLIGLGISLTVYIVYRYAFFKNPKNHSPRKPHFTYKIESE